MKKLRQKVRQIILEEEDEDEEILQGEEHDEEENVEDRVGVENAESGNYYKVNKSHALNNPQKYNQIRETVRQEIRSLLSEKRQGRPIPFVFNGVEVDRGRLALSFKGVEEASTVDPTREELEEARAQVEQVVGNKVEDVEVSQHGGQTNINVYVNPPVLTKKELYKLRLTELNI